jgi:hypothetical protein
LAIVAYSDILVREVLAALSQTPSRSEDLRLISLFITLWHDGTVNNEEPLELGWCEFEPGTLDRIKTFLHLVRKTTLKHSDSDQLSKPREHTVGDSCSAQRHDPDYFKNEHPESLTDELVLSAWQARVKELITTVTSREQDITVMLVYNWTQTRKALVKACDGEELMSRWMVGLPREYLFGV